jgi:NAD(P)-dependent dehydrogenase (short-subunit alcohol dehydrogenase family)
VQRDPTRVSLSPSPGGLQRRDTRDRERLDGRARRSGPGPSIGEERGRRRLTSRANDESRRLVPFTTVFKPDAAVVARAAEERAPGRVGRRMELGLADKVALGRILPSRAMSRPPRTANASSRARSPNSEGWMYSSANMGGPTYGGAADRSNEEWQRAWELVTLGVIRLCRAAAGEMAKRGGGSIVNITTPGVHQRIAATPLSTVARMATTGVAKSRADFRVGRASRSPPALRPRALGAAITESIRPDRHLRHCWDGRVSGARRGAIASTVARGVFPPPSSPRASRAFRGRRERRPSWPGSTTLPTPDPTAAP